MTSFLELSYAGRLYSTEMGFNQALIGLINNYTTKECKWMDGTLCDYTNFAPDYDKYYQKGYPYAYISTDLMGNNDLFYRKWRASKGNSLKKAFVCKKVKELL